MFHFVISDDLGIVIQGNWHHRQKGELQTMKLLEENIWECVTALVCKFTQRQGNKSKN